MPKVRMPTSASARGGGCRDLLVFVRVRLHFHSALGEQMREAMNKVGGLRGVPSLISHPHDLLHSPAALLYRKCQI